MTELIKVGDHLSAIWCPMGEEQQEGAAVGISFCSSIIVDQLPGPMGYYLVAVIRYEGDNDRIIPLHHAESIVRTTT